LDFSICIEPIYQDKNFQDKCLELKNLGFSYIEFWSAEDKDWEWMKSELPINVALFSGQRDGTTYLESDRVGYLQEIEKNILRAKSIGVNTLMLLMDPLNDTGGVDQPNSEIPWSKKLKETITTLGEVGKLGEKYDFHFVFEPLNTRLDHPGYSLASTEKAIEVIKGVDSPRVKLLFDAYHMGMMGEDVYKQVVENLMYIGHIHLANWPGRTGPDSKGEFNFKKFISLLKENNYQGFVGFEYFPEFDSIQSLNAIKELM